MPCSLSQFAKTDFLCTNASQLEENKLKYHKKLSMVSTLSSFFPSTRRSCNALYGDFKLKSYYNVLFHLDGLTSFLCHGFRALYDLTCLITRVLITPFYALNPLAWPGIPEHCMHIADDAVSCLISIATFMIHPIIFLCRTFTSMARGYEEGTEYDWGEEEEVADLDLAMTIF